ncbi:ABC transporter permease [Mycoplasmoides gallisepticum]|uniref:ABC transporter permease n=1 Tax=Mycoplasmoides gallisepticum TaxID=2096 RepID=A0AB36DT49_MYCGL|nr:ABC transporter permease [Mycoplasmoides gallisepticum]OBU78484.1 ABC transporter permease [Mycoplasmoides gallisepticum]OBU78982.1 ABC transporter permease [Mycoplasmoides gallisepticum]OBU79572.1 ABC transporter permease [Mycoplasmoides gallisepticum]OBU79609.1 ABC transporter permease [Mycoplasmoides gallisepticum]OBU80819.1 ABC transporter permease [Mycoplasmoides gallisepticum]
MFSPTQLDQWLILAPALILGVFGGYLSERVGIVNIAINGTMTFGATFFVLFSNIFFRSMGGMLTTTYNWTFLASILLSALLSVPAGILFGVATIKLKADHVIAGTGINLLATGIGQILSDRATTLFGRPSLDNVYNRTLRPNSVSTEAIIIFVLFIVFFMILYVVMNFSKIGLRYRAVGENPNAVDSQGINVNKYQWIGIILASVVAGSGGALFGYYQSGRSFAGDVDGVGFIALAILIVSGWKLLPITIVGLVFSSLLVYSTSTTSVNQSQIFLIRTIPYALTLATMLLLGKFSIGPKNVGNHFDKGLR